MLRLGHSRAIAAGIQIFSLHQYLNDQQLGFPINSHLGYAVCDGGVVIDLSGMQRVEVDADKRVARAGAGSLVRDLDQTTQRFGLATTSGGCPTVGIAGLTLGGGEGWLMPKYGAAPRAYAAGPAGTIAKNGLPAACGSRSTRAPWPR
jgi:hypothetical protein